MIPPTILFLVIVSKLITITAIKVEDEEECRMMYCINNEYHRMKGVHGLHLGPRSMHIHSNVCIFPH